MSRKTISEQDNQVTLFTELRKEFAGYFALLSQRRNQFLQRYPRQVFTGMLICLVTSVVLAFSVMRQKKVSTPSGVGKAGAEMASGLGQILNTGTALKEVLELQSQVEIILKKDSLNQADSLLLEAAFDRLEFINKKLNPKP
ncbi:hypothetical protein SAMN05421813_10354 [Daejeonella rubra]|uniref:Uncharacterized protein n=1 Tax=Daejeonella rubra TaxID=990371 RepID=A0A1G9NKB4_9SPHI|nr:hypothetical protein [Daejeonella rubra]SDL86425.1 hypothetical protein SAMN05421813_10354 [Daejeonella rubra]